MRMACAGVIVAVLAAGCLDIPDPPGGGDEDGDGEPNATDLCPTVEGPQNDSDGDGIGDGCDYDIDADDDIAVFYPLDGAIGDLHPTGPWVPGDDGDSIVLGDDALLGDAFLVAPERFRLVKAELKFRIVAGSEESGTTDEVAVLSSMPLDGSNPDAGTNLYVSSYAEDFEHRATINASDGGVPDLDMVGYVDQGFEVLAGRLLLERRALTMTGEYEGADQDSAGTAAASPAGSTGMLARNATAELFYFYAVGKPP